MAADLDLLKSFVDGQGIGASDYFTYASDHDSNYSDIESNFNQLNAEVKAFSGNNSVLIIDALTADSSPLRQTGFIDEESFSTVSFISGDTQIVIPVGTALTGGVGRLELLVQSTLTGGGGAGARFVALQENGTVTLETVVAQGEMDLYSVDWDGAAFDTGTLLRLETIIPAGDDLFDQQSVTGVSGGAIPPQEHDRIANRFENIERALNGLRTNVVPGGPAIGPVLSLFRGGRMKFVNTNSVTLGSLSLQLNLVPNSTAEFTIEWPGASPVTADITVSGAGGLDTGVEASDTWYAVYVIADTSGVEAVDALLSLSFTSPTLPAGYDIFFRLGAVRNDSASDFLEFLQTNGERNRHHLWVDETLTTTQVLAGGSALVFATVSLAAFVPPSAQRVMITFEFDGNTASADFAIRRPGAGTTRAQSYFSVFPGTTNPFRMPMQEVWTSTTQTIEYEVNSGASALDLFVNGYTDELAGLI